MPATALSHMPLALPPSLPPRSPPQSFGSQMPDVRGPVRLLRGARVGWGAGTRGGAGPGAPSAARRGGGLGVWGGAGPQPREASQLIRRASEFVGQTSATLRRAATVAAP